MTPPPLRPAPQPASESCFFSLCPAPLLLAQGREAQQEQAQHAARWHPADPLPRQGRPRRVGVCCHQHRRKHYCQHPPYRRRYGQGGGQVVGMGPWGWPVAGPWVETPRQRAGTAGGGGCLSNVSLIDTYWWSSLFLLFWPPVDRAVLLLFLTEMGWPLLGARGVASNHG